MDRTPANLSSLGAGPIGDEGSAVALRDLHPAQESGAGPEPPRTGPRPWGGDFAFETWDTDHIHQPL